MEKVLVTGATGFIGSYVIPELLKRGVHVVATSRDAEKAKKSEWIRNVNYVPFDLSRDVAEKNLFEVFDRPDRLIHLAWPGLPDYKSLFHFEKYLPEQYAFLKGLIDSGCKNIAVTGTCFEYGMKTGMLSERDHADPANPYGLAKFTLLRFLQELQKQQPFRLKWVRLFYMYGKGQNPKSIFSQLDKAISAGEQEFNMSGGEQVRDFLPVEKVASNIVGIAMQDKVEDVVNCCSGNPVKLKDLVRSYLDNRNVSMKLNLGYYPYPDYEPMEFWGDSKKLQTIINE
jgi:nucleoside-diphosphate-sugar epimerase